MHFLLVLLRLLMLGSQNLLPKAEQQLSVQLGTPRSHGPLVKEAARESHEVYLHTTQELRRGFRCLGLVVSWVRVRGSDFTALTECLHRNCRCRSKCNVAHTRAARKYVTATLLTLRSNKKALRASVRSIFDNMSQRPEFDLECIA